MLDLIDELHEGAGYIIDILPKTMESEGYFELEEYLMDTYIDEYAEKIVRIVLKIINYYSAQIFLTELPENYCGELKNYPVDTDINGLDIKELADIIRYIIKNDISSVQLLLGDSPYFNISISGGFNIDIYGAADDDLELIEMLVRQEGLFLRKTADT